MFEMVKKFFDFCSKQNRRKFYVSVFLGVLDAMMINDINIRSFDLYLSTNSIAVIFFSFLISDSLSKD